MQKMLIKFTKILIIILLLPKLSFADVASNMSNYIDDMRLSGNYTSPKSWKDNSRYNYSLGSMSYRSKSKILQPFYIRTPEINAGCGGIDMHLGGLSFAGKDEFVAFGKAVISDAQGYALKAALGLLCPSCENWMTELQEIASKMNNYSMNSCAAAKDAVDFLGSKIKTKAEWDCALKSSIANGDSRDPIAARKGCSNLGKAKNTEYSQEEKNEGAPPLNITWRALTDNNTQTSIDLTKYYEILMSMTGTIIYKKDGTIISKNPIAVKDDTIEVLMNGGDLEIYKCLEIKDCENLSKTTHKIAEKDAFFTIVAKHIESIRQKLIKQSNGQVVEYTKEEKNFVANAPYGLPIVRIISIAHSQRKGSEFSIDNIDEWIALSMTYDFLQNMLYQVQRKTSFVANLDKESIDVINNNINALLNNISEKRQELEGKSRSVVEKIKFYDEKEDRESNKVKTKINS